MDRIIKSTLRLPADYSHLQMNGNRITDNLELEIIHLFFMIIYILFSHWPGDGHLNRFVSCLLWIVQL